MPDMIWRCSLCREIFEDQTLANNCEIAHSLLANMSIVEASFPIEDLSKKITFPDRITVKFSDRPRDLADYKMLPHRLKPI